jgi:hypothetical protein
MRNRSIIADIFRFNSSKLERLKYPYPDSGVVIDGDRYYAVPSAQQHRLSDYDDDDDAVNDEDAIDRAVKITLKMSPLHSDKDARVLTPLHYPTPRRGITHASTLTERSTRDLPSVLLNCEESKAMMATELEAAGIAFDGAGGGQGQMDSGENGGVASLSLLRPHAFAVQSVNYVEWMMGYPPGWTDLNYQNQGTESNA